MVRFVLCGLAVLVWLVSGISHAAATEKRVALVIGNSAYRHAPGLKTPRNDAADVAAVLSRLDFKVLEGFDLDKAGMDRAVRNMAAAMAGADVGVFFYAGHGLQVAGSNYLMPVDAQLATPAALDVEMVRLDVVQGTMEHEAPTNVLFLDASRDNPLSRSLARAMGPRSVEIGQGLAAAEANVGTLISFSTQPGDVALDGDGRSSPYAGALIKAIPTPGEDLSNMLVRVRHKVMAATRDSQVPWVHSALRGRFYFSPPRAAGPSGQAAPVWPPAPKREEQARPPELSPEVSAINPRRRLP